MSEIRKELKDQESKMQLEIKRQGERLAPWRSSSDNYIIRFWEGLVDQQVFLLMLWDFRVSEFTTTTGSSKGSK